MRVSERADEQSVSESVIQLLQYCAVFYCRFFVNKTILNNVIICLVRPLTEVMPLRLCVNMVFSVPISFLAPRIAGMSQRMPESPSTGEAMLVVVNELLFWAASFPVLLFYLWGCVRIWKQERCRILRKSCQGLVLVLQTVVFWLFQHVSTMALWFLLLHACNTGGCGPHINFNHVGALPLEKSRNHSPER